MTASVSFWQIMVDTMTRDVPLVSKKCPSSLPQQFLVQSKVNEQILESFDLGRSLEDKILAMFGASHATNYGSLPTLNWAIQHKLSIDTIETLLNTRPDSTQLCDEFGNSPLHIALMNKAPSELIQKLVIDHGCSVTTRNKEKKNALHIAVENFNSEEVFEILSNADTEAVTMKDNTGATPIHLAIKYNVSAQGLRSLLKKRPDAVLMKDFGDHTPFKLAIKFKSDKSIIQVLLDCFDKLENITKSGIRRRKKVSFSKDTKGYGYMLVG